MKVYIQYIYFPNEELYKFIKNDTNNENWPKANKYLKTLTEEFGGKIRKQKIVVDQYREYLTKRQKKGDDSFLIRVKNEINNKIKILRDPEFKQLEGAERKRELENLQNARDIYERYFDFKGDWADTVKIEGTDLILTYEKLRKWNEERDYPIKAISDLLDEWEEDINKTDNAFEKIEELRTYEIEVLERTADTITFIWRVAKDPEAKQIIFPNIKKNYLFFFYGEFFEVQDWEQTATDTVEIIAEISIFYNFYWYVIKSSANGILHHSPLAKEEICSCPEYDVATNYYSFGSTYKLRMGLYKMSKELLNTGSYIETAELPIVAPINLWHVEDPAKEVAGEGKGFFANLWDGLWDSTVGTCYFNLSSRLGKYAYAEQWHHVPQSGVDYSKGSSIGIDWKKIDGAKGEPTGENIRTLLKRFNLVKDDGSPNLLMYHFLRLHIKATLFWRQKQIWQGNFWLLFNSFQIWETVNPAGTSVNIYGNNRIVGKLTESITMKVGGNAFVNKFFEVIVDTALTDEKGTQNRQTERSVVSDTRSKSGAVTHKEEKTKSNAVSPVGKGKPNLGSSFLRPSLYSVDHTKAEYTGYQFLHRWVLSGIYPVMMIIEFNQNLLNQYLNRKELKGKPAYDYFNALTFGTILNSSGYLQASIISWDMVPYANWFREKIEAGIFIYDEDPKEFYKKKISSPLNIASFGGTTRGGFNIISLGKRLKGGIGRDNAVNIDNMSWVWKASYTRKPSYCRPISGGTDLLPGIMTGGTLGTGLKINDTYAWKFDGYHYGSNSAKIPKGIKYEWSLQGYSEGANDKCDFTGLDEDGSIAVHQRGAEWELEFIGNFNVERKIGNPEGVPPQTDPGVNPLDPFDKDPEPIGQNIPNPIPAAGMPDPFGGGLGGDPELEPPEPEAPELEPPEPEAPEKEPEPEAPEPEPEPEKPKEGEEDPEMS